MQQEHPVYLSDPPPAVTVVLIGLTDPKELRDALASVGLQVERSWEAVVLADPASPGAVEACRIGQVLGSSRVRVVPGSPATPVAEVLAAARGAHLLVLGPGRLLAPEMLATASSALRERPDAPCAFADEIDVSSPAPELVRSAALSRLALAQGGAAPGAPLFRKAALERRELAGAPVSALLDPRLGPWRGWAERGPLPVHVEEALVLRRPAPEGAPRYTVTAVVSAFKSTRFLAGCLQDLVEQTLYAKGRLEIMVVDTGSPEDEGAIVREFQARHPHIRYIRTPDRRTLYAAWNMGIRAARGAYITNANTDDRHRADALEVMARALERTPEVALVYADQIYTDQPNETFVTTSSNTRRVWAEFSRPLLRVHCMVGPQPMWRRTVHERHGYFDEEFVSAGDYEFWLRMATTELFVKINDVLGLYYWNPDGIEHSSPRTGAETLLALERHGIAPGGEPCGGSTFAPYVQGAPMRLRVSRNRVAAEATHARAPAP